MPIGDTGAHGAGTETDATAGSGAPAAGPSEPSEASAPEASAPEARPSEVSDSTRSTPAGTTRAERMEKRIRNDKWKNIPLRIEMSECINCDTCLRHCPPQFGAIFNHGIDVIIIPELCSGCGKCLPPVCPVDCIYEDPDWTPAPDDWWQEPLTADVY